MRWCGGGRGSGGFGGGGMGMLNLKSGTVVIPDISDRWFEARFVIFMPIALHYI